MAKKLLLKAQIFALCAKIRVQSARCQFAG